MSARMRIILVALASAIALIAVSPPLLLLLALVPVDWPMLSAVGQSYTGISVLLSGAALLGVVASLRLQRKQTDILRTQATRQFQMQVLQMSMEDPDLAALHAGIPSAVSTISGHRDYRRLMYTTIRFRHLHFGFQTGDVSPVQLKSVLEHEFFPIAANRRWWDLARPSWSGDASDDGYLGFLNIVDSAYAACDPAAS